MQVTKEGEMEARDGLVEQYAADMALLLCLHSHLKSLQLILTRFRGVLPAHVVSELANQAAACARLVKAVEAD